MLSEVLVKRYINDHIHTYLHAYIHTSALVQCSYSCRITLLTEIKSCQVLRWDRGTRRISEPPTEVNLVIVDSCQSQSDQSANHFFNAVHHL